MITVATAIVAASVFFFLVPSTVSVGSISGLAIVISNFVPLPISAITFVLNVVLLIVGFIFIGKEFVANLLGAVKLPCAELPAEGVAVLLRRAKLEYETVVRVVLVDRNERSGEHQEAEKMDEPFRNDAAGLGGRLCLYGGGLAEHLAIAKSTANRTSATHGKTCDPGILPFCG